MAVAASLDHPVTLELTDVPLEEALRAISDQADLSLSYSRRIVPLDRRITLRAEPITAREALERVLSGTELELYVSSSGQVALVPRPIVEAERETARAGTIVGRVTDADSGAGISGASVLLEATNLGALTGNTGQYRIADVPAGTYTIVVSSLGYEEAQQSVTVADGATATADFNLEISPTTLDEMVITVTGEQRRREVGHSVAAINADSVMSNAPVLSFGDLVQGRAPGALSFQLGSNSGQSGRIRLRGLNTFAGTFQDAANAPIVVVDGVRVEATAGNYTFNGLVGSPTASTSAGGFSGRLGDLNPHEIESVEIVKGPSAATLYGTDAANGVIVITTKRGQPGRPRWTVFTEQGILEQRLEDWDAQWGAGGPAYAFGRSTATGAPERCTLLGRASGACVADSLASFNAYTHPETRPFRTGSRQQYGLQVSGGTRGGTTYFLSGQYEHETGTAHMPPADQAYLRTLRGVSDLPDWQIRPNAFDRVNLRANVRTPVGDNGDITITTGFVSNETRRIERLPHIQVGYRDSEDGWLPSRRPAYGFATFRGDVVRRFTGSLASTYAFNQWLNLRGTVGADLSTNDFGSLLRRGEGPPAFLTTGQRVANQLDVIRYSLDLSATATHALSRDVTSKTSMGVQYNRRAQRANSITASNLPLAGETIAGAADPLAATEGTLTTAIAGGYIEETVNFRDRLFLTGALRFDGGSAFGEDFSVAGYPKASVSWVVADDRSGPRLPGVSSLRIRAAYGVSGVQPGPFDALQQIQVVTGVNDGDAVPAAQLGSFGNSQLRPERATEFEGGVDLDIAAGRAQLELTAYQRTTHDALINRSLAPSVGGSSRWENIGSVRNRGMELLLNAHVLQTEILSAGITVSGAVNDNELLELGEGVVVSSPTQQGWRQDVGYPLYGIWGRRVESYADANGNGIMEPDEITLTDNEYFGPSYPPREASIAPYLRLWGDRLHFTGMLQYQGGNYVVNYDHGNTCRFDLSCRAVNDPSTPLGEQAQAVAYSQFAAVGAMAIQPAGYLLVRELSAGLTLPNRWARALGAETASLVLASRNAAVLWKEGVMLAPESGIGSLEANQAAGADAGPPTYWIVRFSISY